MLKITKEKYMLQIEGKERHSVHIILEVIFFV